MRNGWSRSVGEVDWVLVGVVALVAASALEGLESERLSGWLVFVVAEWSAWL